MDNRNVYKECFDELLNRVKENAKHDYPDQFDDNYIVDISGNAFRKYRQKIIDNESDAINILLKMIYRLLDIYRYTYTIPRVDCFNAYGEQPYSFVMQDNQYRNAYYISFAYPRLKELRKCLNKQERYNNLIYVVVRKDSQDFIDQCNRLEELYDDGYIRFVSFEDFFCQLFGQEEYCIFLNYADAFNILARDNVGYNTIALPSKVNIQKFGTKIDSILTNRNYQKLLPKALDNVQRQLIIDNYIYGKRYMAMIDKTSFSDSFISSEWFYSNVPVTGIIDQTGIVVGYLKSVEQLLYSLIRIRIDTNKHIAIRQNQKKLYPGRFYDDCFVDYTTQYENLVDTTLGALIRYITHKENGVFVNNDIFCVSANSIQVIVDELYNFKDIERNERLHRHNIYSVAEVDDIRNKAHALYCLLLGGFKLNPSDFNRLINYSVYSSPPITISENELYKKIKEWIMPVLNNDVPKDVKMIAFMINNDTDGEWDIYVRGYNKIPNDLDNILLWNNFSFTTIQTNPLMWESDEDYLVEKEKLINALKSLLDDGETSVSLKQYEKVVVGKLAIIDELYSK